MRKHIWLLSGLLVLSMTASSRADFNVRLGGDPAADVPFQTLDGTGEATVDPVHRWGAGARIAVGSVRFGLAVGATAAGYRPYYWGGYRPFYWGGYRPFYWGGYRPYYSAGYRPWYRPYVGGYYSSYSYPSYSYYDPYSYGCSYSVVGAYTPPVTINLYSPPPGASNVPPVMPSAPDANGTYPYDGGPRTLPYSNPPPNPTINPQPRPTLPREGRIAMLKAPAYPAYGETTPVSVATPSVRVNYPAYGEAPAPATILVRSGSE